MSFGTSAPSRRATGATAATSCRPLSPDRPARVGLVGAGFIAGHHLDALARVPGIELAAICDLDPDRAEALRREHGIAAAHDDLDVMLREESLDVAHVLVPPPHHARIIRRLLDAGVHVLAEKPLAPEAETCEELGRRAVEAGVRLGVNHNFLYHPTFERLVADVEAGRVGPLSHVRSVTHVPLRQLATGELDHWMFRHPGNILLEQAPHPFGQVFRLLGPPRQIDVQAADRRDLDGRPFFATWQILMTCREGTASVHLSFGHDAARNAVTALGRDGSARADLGLGTYALRRQSRYIEPVDLAVTALREARDVARDGVGQLADYARSLLLRGPRTDAFYRTMHGSIGAFYAALREGRPAPVGAAEGAAVVSACETVMSRVQLPPTRVASPAPRRAPRPDVDALVLGGTGFIGGHLLERLREDGLRLRLGTRRPGAAAGDAPDVDPVPVDLRDREAVLRAVRGARQVVHLAAGAYDDWEQYRQVYLRGLDHVVEACVREGVERLVYTSTIAAYYLGRRAQRVDESTPLDRHPGARAHYARAKIAAEGILRRARERHGLEVVVLRPGVVVGPGGVVEHTGVGLWPGPLHCLGWGRGDLRLPLVLVQDVADALAATIRAGRLPRRSYNLVGDVRLTAREYVRELGRARGGQVQFHPRSIARLWALELLKYGVKRVGGRRAERPSYRDLRTRTLAATFDCAAAKRDLRWQPEADREAFVRRGIVAALPRRHGTDPGGSG